MEEGKSCVLLISGGMDSVTLLHWLLKEMKYYEVIGITFRYGQRHEREVLCAVKQMKLLGQLKHHMIDLSFLAPVFCLGTSLVVGGREIPALADLSPIERRQPSTYVPNRNMIFLSIGAGIAEAMGVNEIYYSAQAQDEYGYWDCTEEFVNRINWVLSLNRKNGVSIRAPFLRYRKSEIVKLGLRLGVDYSLTWSCYRGEDKACGVCPTCVERLKAFEEAEVKDPIAYEEMSN